MRAATIAATIETFWSPLLSLSIAFKTSAQTSPAVETVPDKTSTRLWMATSMSPVGNQIPSESGSRGG
eukprot:879268-Amorphochlora_amoeboformis.AAC.1